MGTILSSHAFAESSCPVDHKNMSKDQIHNLMQSKQKISPVTDQNQNLKPHQQYITPQPCPVDHSNMSEAQIEAYFQRHRKILNQPSLTTEPSSPSSKTIPKMYDVYGQEIHHANLMPATPNQLPAPGQQKPLSTDRQKSTIPKSGEQQATWTYPSPQMFYNALKRKGKAEDVQESDMPSVVSIHNTMNERTWREVMKWESRFHCQCDNPKLKKFLGRPNDLSPAARFRTTFRGYPMPFDRHDWVIDRCGHEEARYIIDYYYRDGPDPIDIHVRPALDSLSAVSDRVRHVLTPESENILLEEPKKDQSNDPGQTAGVVAGEQVDSSEFSFLSGLSVKAIQNIGWDVQKRCKKLNQEFSQAASDPDMMGKANISVNYCMAQIICKRQASDFMKALENGQKNGNEAYAEMTSCLDRFYIMARRTLMEEAGVIQVGPEFSANPFTSSKTSADPSAA